MWLQGFWSVGFWGDSFWADDSQTIEFRFVFDAIQASRQVQSFHMPSVFLIPDDSRQIEPSTPLRDIEQPPMPEITALASAVRSVVAKSQSRSFLS